MTSASVSIDPGRVSFDVGRRQLLRNPRKFELSRNRIAARSKPFEATSSTGWHTPCISHAPRVSPKVNRMLSSASQVQFARVASVLASVLQRTRSVLPACARVKFENTELTEPVQNLAGVKKTLGGRFPRVSMIFARASAGKSGRTADGPLDFWVLLTAI